MVETLVAVVVDERGYYHDRSDAVGGGKPQ